MPFFVSERLCSANDLGGESQAPACEVDYEAIKVRSQLNSASPQQHKLAMLIATLQKNSADGSEECQLWPAPGVDLSAVEPQFRAQINALQWYKCLPKIK